MRLPEIFTDEERRLIHFTEEELLDYLEYDCELPYEYALQVYNMVVSKLYNAFNKLAKEYNDLLWR